MEGEGDAEVKIARRRRKRRAIRIRSGTMETMNSRLKSENGGEEGREA